MAIIKAISSGANLKNAIKYISADAKTNAALLTGVGCSAANAYEQMQFVKDLYRKNGGQSYTHLTHSYHADEDVTPEQAHKNALDLVAATPEFDGFQVLVATHIDKKHIHSHIIINSVSAEDGHKARFNKYALAKLKERCNAQSAAQGLSVPVKGKTFSGEVRQKKSTWRRETYQQIEKAEQKKAPSYILKIKNAALECAASAKSRAEFVAMMNERGISTSWTDNRKHITFTDIERQATGERKCKIRNAKLAQYFNIDFSKENLESTFAMNKKRDISRASAPSIREQKTQTPLEMMAYCLKNYYDYKATGDTTAAKFWSAQYRNARDSYAKGCKLAISARLTATGKRVTSAQNQAAARTVKASIDAITARANSLARGGGGVTAADRRHAEELRADAQGHGGIVAGLRAVSRAGDDALKNWSLMTTFEQEKAKEEGMKTYI